VVESQGEGRGRERGEGEMAQRGRWPGGRGRSRDSVILFCSFLFFFLNLIFFGGWFVCVAFFVPDERLLKYNAKQLKTIKLLDFEYR